MKKTLLFMTTLVVLAAMTACGGKEEKSNPEQEKATVEMETISDDLDSTLEHLKDLETELESALEDLDLGEE